MNCNDVQIPALIKRWGQKRITQRTYDLFCEKGPEVRSIWFAENGQPIAFAAARLDELQTQVIASAICVHPAHRRQGYGSIVLAGLQGALAQVGIRYWAEVADDNEASRGLLEKAGMSPVADTVAWRKKGPYVKLTYEGNSNDQRRPTENAGDGILHGV